MNKEIHPSRRTMKKSGKSIRERQINKGKAPKSGPSSNPAVEEGLMKYPETREQVKIGLKENFVLFALLAQ
jgi:hypothetical protein